MAIKEYLKKNTLIREELINNKLLYDIKRAAALRGYHLKTYPARVDIEGFDLIIDDDDLLRKIQIKTTLDATTKSWEIHRIMLRPNHSVFADYQFYGGVGCPKNHSGVLLLNVLVDAKNEIRLEYYYTDINILLALEIGVISTNKHSKNHANSLLNDLRNTGTSHDTIGVSKGLFIKLASAEMFLAISGFHSNLHTPFDFHIWQLSKKIITPERDYANNKERIKDLKTHWDVVQDEIRKMKSRSSLIITKNPITKSDYINLGKRKGITIKK